MTPFLVFADDDHAVALDKVVGFSAVKEEERHRPMPAGAQTRIDTVQGYFWVTTSFSEILDQILLLQGGDRG